MKWLEKFLIKCSGNFKLSRRQIIFTAAILLFIGGGLRCVYWQMRERPARDEKVYIQIVEEINGVDAARKRAKLMTEIAGFWVWQYGYTPENCLRCLNFIYSLLWIGVVFFLCYDIFDSYKAGLLGMALAAFNPYSIRMACQILREPLYILIFTLAIWCSVKIIKSSRYSLYPAILGILAVLGLYTRTEGFEIIIFPVLAVIVSYFSSKNKDIKLCAINLIIYFLFFVLSVLLLANWNEFYFDKYQERFLCHYDFLIKEWQK